MRQQRRTAAQWVSWCVVVSCVGVATATALGSERATLEPTRADARQAARRFAETEPQRRIEAAQQFPGDRWSQDDDFHHQEEKWIRDQATHSGLTAGELLHAIDADLRARPPGDLRKSTASPCKPRPVTD